MHTNHAGHRTPPIPNADAAENPSKRPDLTLVRHRGESGMEQQRFGDHYSTRPLRRRAAIASNRIRKTVHGTERFNHLDVSALTGFRKMAIIAMRLWRLSSGGCWG